jgi:hypothetical protein
LKEAWMISQTENIKGDKIKALALAKEYYAMKLEMLTNAAVVDDAIWFVASHAISTEKANSDKVDANAEVSDQEEQHSIGTANTVF